ncbi:hypothetical protein [Neptunomonas sp.]|uniref:hypothetical protein n=1 Tax=Neptunomonas sp. TaxID=1971898 RepID=UPI0025E2403E|nr:hypothetical protein [Neptunomonas sp.]
MDTDLLLEADNETIRATLLSCSEGDAVNCLSEEVFAQAKLLLVKEKITGISIQLVGDDGYVIRQVTGKRRSELGTEEFNDRQLAVIKALEKVLRHCQQEGIKLVGYSDELVAYPAGCNDPSQASIYALDIDSSEAYTGADSNSELMKI